MIDDLVRGLSARSLANFSYLDVFVEEIVTRVSIETYNNTVVLRNEK